MCIRDRYMGESIITESDNLQRTIMIVNQDNNAAKPVEPETNAALPVPEPEPAAYDASAASASAAGSLTGGVFGTELQRGFFIFLSFIILLGFESKCEDELGYVRDWFIAAMLIFYGLSLLNVFTRVGTTWHFGYATKYQSIATFVIAAFAVTSVLQHSDTCNATNSILAILCYTLIIYAAFKLFGDLVAFILWAATVNDPSARRQQEGSFWSGFLGYRGDSMAGGLATTVMLICLYYFNTDTCYDAAMSTVEYYVFVVVVLAISMVVFIFCGGSAAAILSGSQNRNEAEAATAVGILCFFLAIFNCLLCILSIAFIVLYVMLMINFFSSKNDCREKAPYIEFFMAYIAWSIIAYLLLVFAILFTYLCFPGIDRWKTETAPTTEESAPLISDRTQTAQPNDSVNLQIDNSDKKQQGTGPLIFKENNR
eukprot:TRINITY_DN1594_c0_g2_i2.p1 TRINITY_DN1594_c0_g2~~TRINITY_DN1594_c0_g2_i2.p1  ORF type:complete len:456 (-),score=182.93 TRINITY_DN1594_c0_g2_i2:301-1581(-)